MLVSANRQNVPLSSVDVKRKREAMSFPFLVDEDLRKGYNYFICVGKRMIE